MKLKLRFRSGRSRIGTLASEHVQDQVGARYCGPRQRKPAVIFGAAGHARVHHQRCGIEVPDLVAAEITFEGGSISRHRGGSRNDEADGLETRRRETS